MGKSNGIGREFSPVVGHGAGEGEDHGLYPRDGCREKDQGVDVGLVAAPFAQVPVNRVHGERAGARRTVCQAGLLWRLI
jgi:hypothetical protein